MSGGVGGLWAHSGNCRDEWQGLAEHLRATAELARRFATPFGAGDLAAALGLFHDAGKAACSWQDRLRVVAGTGRRVGLDHKELGARLLLDVAGPCAMAILGHHGGLGEVSDVRALVGRAFSADEMQTVSRLVSVLPEVGELVSGPVLVPDSWRGDALIWEMGLRLTFSALVDADHLDTGAHLDGLPAAQVSDPADLVEMVRRFESRRRVLLDGSPATDVNCLRGELYEDAVQAARCPPGLFRLPAPTGSGKTMTAAAFALHHAARHGKSRVIVAVPYTTITEQNAQVYRDLLGEEVVLEHHSGVTQDGWRSRLGAENWDAPFVVTTTVQLFDSLFGRMPSRSRKLHRLANAVIVLDEVQALPAALLVPILDGLRLLTEHFGTTVLLASATQPAFQQLRVWKEQNIHDVVSDPASVYERLRRVRYEWWLDPQPTPEEVADRVAGERQALVVVNTIADARRMFGLLAERVPGHVRHLSTRMCPAHRRRVLAEVRTLLANDDPVILVSTQLIEAGVDVDFPAVYRALAGADSLQQAAGRANREGLRSQPGRVVVFDAVGAGHPPAYTTQIDTTRRCFGPGLADPDDLVALADYYRRLYAALGTDDGPRARAVQENRRKFDFAAVADGPLRNVAEGRERDGLLAFRMLDDDTAPVVAREFAPTLVDELLDLLRSTEGTRRDLIRRLQPYIVALPRQLARRDDIRALCRPVAAGLDLVEWQGPYDADRGIDEGDIARDSVW